MPVGHRLRPNRITLMLAIVLFAALAPIHAQTPSRSSQPRSSQSQKRMADAVDRVLQDALQAHLPPHLSTLLGLSNEQEAPVVQRAVRSGNLVQGFDVSNANHNDVVLFVVDESTDDQTLYLTSPRGELRKIVSVKEGTGSVHPITAEDQEAFAKQKQFWLDRLAPLPNSK